MIAQNKELLDRITRFMAYEAMSCSMDYGCVTPLYVYRMWGGAEPYEEIEKALDYLRANNYGY